MRTVMRPVTRLACALLLLSCALPGAAGKRVFDESFLTAEERPLLPGKTFAIAVHPQALHAKITDGSVWAGAFNMYAGMAKMHTQGDAAVEAFGPLDPTPMVRELLSQLLQDVHGMEALPPIEGRIDLNAKPKYLALRHPEADYVLSVTGSTMHGEYFTGKRARASVSMGMQLVNVKTQHTVASMSCIEMTKERDTNPTVAELESDDGAQLKAVLETMAAMCVRKFATRLRLPDDKLLALPQWNQDPFAPWSPPATTQAPTQATQ